MAQLSCTPLSARRLDAYRVALELVSLLQPVVTRIAREDKDLAAQLRRALPSVPQNLAEAMRRTGRDRAHLLTVALGSADEVRCLVDVALINQQQVLSGGGPGGAARRAAGAASAGSPGADRRCR